MSGLAFTTRQSNRSPTGVWAFFDEVGDVTNLNPAEEQNEAWEAVENGEVVGMAVVDTFASDFAFVNRVAVKDEYRRCGVATHLLRTMRIRHGRLRCRVHRDNEASQALVEGFGFERTGTGRYDELYLYDTNP